LINFSHAEGESDEKNKGKKGGLQKKNREKACPVNVEPKRTRKAIRRRLRDAVGSVLWL